MPVLNNKGSNLYVLDCTGAICILTQKWVSVFKIEHNCNIQNSIFIINNRKLYLSVNFQKLVICLSDILRISISVSVSEYVNIYARIYTHTDMWIYIQCSGSLCVQRDVANVHITWRGHVISQAGWWCVGLICYFQKILYPFFYVFVYNYNK